MFTPRGEGIAPGRRGARVHLHHDVQMVAHDGVDVNGDGEARAELMKPFLDPDFAMLEGLSGVAVGAAEKGASYAALDAVVAGVAAWRGEVETGGGDETSATERATRAESSGRGVGAI